ncbi:MAG: nuclear transport factor 2 family protein [Gammaproteobacteria bacterium]|nr:nuclear transport factor 2 family protein [Gammaproteobacteria bacterium]
MASATDMAIARQEIEYLRRRYARATDLIGEGSSDSLAQGRRIYHEIFTADARIRTSLDGEVQLQAEGPDSWVDVAHEALKEYVATQHLVGSQLVELVRLETDANGQVRAGEATMTSYLQAWHARADSVWVFIGSYVDQVRHFDGRGWQIHDMELIQLSSEDRPLGSLSR